jgi:hypothetical protein
MGREAIKRFRRRGGLGWRASRDGHVDRAFHRKPCVGSPSTGEPLAGYLPTRALRLLREWTALHKTELQLNWEQAQARRPLAKIDPLP